MEEATTAYIGLTNIEAKEDVKTTDAIKASKFLRRFHGKDMLPIR